jgi:hypothetical protein
VAVPRAIPNEARGTRNQQQTPMLGAWNLGPAGLKGHLWGWHWLFNFIATKRGDTKVGRKGQGLGDLGTSPPSLGVSPAGCQFYF